jgi:hypothetical protein
MYFLKSFNEKIEVLQGCNKVERVNGKPGQDEGCVFQYKTNKVMAICSLRATERLIKVKNSCFKQCFHILLRILFSFIF